MHKSLTIILPVRNAQSTLEVQVDHILEFLPEITTEFELLIIDDASDDLTEDVAIDLARRYPQVRILRQSQPKGHAAAVEAGLARTTGEIVFVSDPGVAVTEADIQHLWKLRDDRELVMARTQVEPRPLDQSLLQRLMSWGEAVRSANSATEIPVTTKPGTIQMIRRGAIESLTEMDQPENALTVDRNQKTDTVRVRTNSGNHRIEPPQRRQPTGRPDQEVSTSTHLSYF